MSEDIVLKGRPEQLRELISKVESRKLTDVLEKQVFERADEEQILREISGEIVENFIYEFETKDGKKIVGLSYAGVKYFIQKMGYMEVTGLEYSYNPETKQWIAVAKVRDRLRDLETVGAAEANAFDEKGNLVPFAFRLAVHKAIRNAWRAQINDVAIAKIIKLYLELRKKVGRKRASERAVKKVVREIIAERKARRS